MARKKRDLGEEAGAKRKCPHCQGKRSWYDEKGQFHICACQMRGRTSFSTGEARKILGVSRSHVVRLVDKGVLPGLKNPFTKIRDISREGIIKLIKDAKVIFHDESGEPLGCMAIPVIPAAHSVAFRPPIPIDSGRLFRRIPATPSERSDAGVEIFLNERSGRVKL